MTGKAIEKIKGLGYSEAGYKAAKVRLVRKYGGNRWEIQCHVEELLKILENNMPKNWKQLQTCCSVQ